MIVLQNTVISDDIRDNSFVCNLEKCKGACCVEGDLGAPLEESELAILEESYEHIKPYMTGAGKLAVEEQGLYIKDFEGDYSTPTIENRECAYALYDDKGILKCAIEQAYYDGKISWKKPISCHLYPIRVTKYDDFEALNYDRWSICAAACNFGQDLGVRVYQFLKEPLIRKYGESWYNELTQLMEEEPEKV
ncbi:DUF3109 family protein [Pontibacter sp. BT310]|uniref:DUF3109 family protein n=1 Tax=Pontibacter populi TaxID=890055 RepID=A0ABS6XBM4_9BACT|nr:MULTISPECIES: DUF3109 family protein [Pontibacter]MBJ6118505.1 DUF3109 family protein [Pontibacter sp. BT310]MBR0570934.1 DUF3109 family protein [Microvirga sp. STS03]MBW3365359.1 DUF3109 family protein [Pontibacter populi]